MNRLLLIERVIIEACTKDGRTIFEISNDTGMELSLVNALCIRLSKKGILKRRGSGYFLEAQATEFIEANKPDNLKKEVEEVTSALVENYFTNNTNRILKLQKVYVDKSEEKILNSLLNQLNSFVSQLQQANRLHPKNQIKDQKVIMWGHSNYNDLIESSLRMVK